MVCNRKRESYRLFGARPNIAQLLSTCHHSHSTIYVSRAAPAGRTYWPHPVLDVLHTHACEKLMPADAAPAKNPQEIKGYPCTVFNHPFWEPLRLGNLYFCGFLSKLNSAVTRNPKCNSCHDNYGMPLPATTT